MIFENVKKKVVEKIRQLKQWEVNGTNCSNNTTSNLQGKATSTNITHYWLWNYMSIDKGGKPCLDECFMSNIDMKLCVSYVRLIGDQEIENNSTWHIFHHVRFLAALW